jgi:F0F1-type ATP synthase membrane subunit b/b'
MLFWLALAAWLVLTVAGIAFAVVRAVALWRAFKRAGGALRSRVEAISRSAEQIETHLANAEAASGRLHAAGRRLGRSRAELDVLLGAVREARAAVSLVLPFASPPRRR